MSALSKFYYIFLSSCLSTCHSLTSTLLVLVERPANWRGYTMFSQRRAITERERERERKRTSEDVNGDGGMIFGQLYNWLLIQCSLHIRGSPPPLTLWLIRCSQTVVTQATKINLSHNENVSWQLTLLFFPSLSFPVFCLSPPTCFFL